MVSTWHRIRRDRPGSIPARLVERLVSIIARAFGAAGLLDQSQELTASCLQPASESVRVSLCARGLPIRVARPARVPSDRGRLAVSVDDATYVKVRQNGRIVSVAVIVAVGVKSDGRREVLGKEREARLALEAEVKALRDPMEAIERGAKPGRNWCRRVR
jgi:hypothetical protein